MSDVYSEHDGGVTTIVMNRPDRKNVVDGPMAAQLRAALEEFESDDDQRVAVLWGAGADMTCPDGSGPMGPTRLALSKPLIAAVSGYAGAGTCRWPTRSAPRVRRASRSCWRREWAAGGTAGSSR